MREKEPVADLGTSSIIIWSTKDVAIEKTHTDISSGTFLLVVMDLLFTCVWMQDRPRRKRTIALRASGR
jgi:hypothetical protein